MENTRALAMAVGGRKGKKKRRKEGTKGGRKEKQSLTTNRIKIKVDWRLLCLEPRKADCDLTGLCCCSVKEWFGKKQQPMSKGLDWATLGGSVMTLTREMD